MEQVDRIVWMEQILDEAEGVVGDLERSLDRYETLQDKLAALEEYYSGPLWRQDLDDDEAGRLPADLKRGVLSQDAVYDLLDQRHQLLKRLKRLAKEK